MKKAGFSAGAIKYLWVILLLTVTQVKAFNNYIWHHYTAEDGLAQNTVMSILQDKKGYLWMGTWDGLSRFDGYSFTSYKIRPGDDVEISSSRIDYITQDKYGFIWLLDYGKNVCRFDPRTETFINVPKGEESFNISVSNIISLSNGVTWLVSDEEGAIRVTTDTATFDVTSKLYFQKNQHLAGNSISGIVNDEDGNEWVLTDNGLLFIGNEDGISVPYFTENDETSRDRQPFFCFLDKGDELWFGSVNGRIWKYRKHEGLFVLLQLSTDADIVSFHKFKSGKVFIATRTDGVFVYDDSSATPMHFTHQNSPGLSDVFIQKTFKDSEDNIWIQQNIRSITQFNPNNMSFTKHHLPPISFDSLDAVPFMILEDINKVLWIHPMGGGLSYFDRETQSVVPFFNKLDKLWQFSEKLHRMYSDRQGNLWVCTRSKGLERFTFLKTKFGILQVDSQSNVFNENSVRSVFEDHMNRIWLADKTGRLVLFDKNRRRLGFLNKNGKLSSDSKFSFASIYSITQDDDENIWLGTKGAGIIKLTPNKSDLSSFDVENFRFDQTDLYSLSNDNVYDIHKDYKGRLWIATYGGGINLLQRDNNGRVYFLNHRNHLVGYPVNKSQRVRMITSDRDGTIFVATTNGLILFNGNFNDPEKIQFTHFTYLANDSTCLSNNDVHDVVVTSKGEVFVATFGGGLNKLVKVNDRPAHFRFEYFNKEDGLASDVLLSIVEDDKGFLWLSSENSIAKFNSETKEFINFDKKDYLRYLSFSEAANCIDKSGKLWFGTSQGVLFFHPDSIQKDGFVPPLVFTDLRLFNRKVKVDPGSVLSQHLDMQNEIVLKHNQNIFSVGFAALDLKFPESVKYAAILEGVDSEWKFLDHQRLVHYTKLPHGKYLLRVKSTNGDGTWVDNERQLSIVILPSFWETPWAYLIYFLFVASITSVSIYIFFTIYRLRNKVEMEHKLAEMKFNFFTDISHELRTPLTLITGPLEQVMKINSLPEVVRNKLSMVAKNSTRLLEMVNQVLDFVKLQQIPAKLKIENIEIVSFVSRVMDNFRLTAMERNVEFSLECSCDELRLWVDVDKLEKIIFNLLSNAFKYLDAGLFVKLYILDAGNWVRIDISDDGIGIADDFVESAFLRFENLSDCNRPKKDSSGIGLSIVKKLVELHHGKVTVAKGETRGTTFSILLPKGRDHFEPGTEIVEPVIELESQTCLADDASVDATNSPLDDDGLTARHSLLIVEDNEDVRLFIRESLQDEFEIFEAANGKEGMELALKMTPDFIISDVMMPLMDGIEFLKLIRSNIETSHIPFVLLSAKVNLESRLEGIDKGADDYITKPFSMVYLQSRIRNLLDQRKKLQLANHNFSFTEYLNPSIPEVTRLDEKFLSDLKAVMEKNIDNGALVVEDLVSEMNVSRSVFFKKLKSLTGLAPIEYIREMRLKRAAQLIETGQYNMTQISYMVGINDPRYFSKCFKQLFGEAPSVYKARKISVSNDGKQ
ncbi:two-component regulator propeller domain-containing protein [Geofilum sp. OHC36d9]|uniref:two-component regulator propeller domain-containing protein n=1 Tax=Geofilum sp. OHC36d9 TaxID=3458413 RepID=UPI0040333884